MNNVIHYLLIVISVAFWGTSFDALALQNDSRERLALVIGNEKYRHSPLDFPVRDARSMRDVLQLHGFDVSYHENLSQNAMRDEVERFRRRLAPSKSIAFFYYAGHGQEIDGENYLVPITTADLKSEEDIQLWGVKLSGIKSKLALPQNLSVLVIDACRNNEMRKNRTLTGNGLKALIPPSGMLIAYSTAEGETAADDSVYTPALVEALKDSCQEPARLEDIFYRVNNEMKNNDVLQEPWTNSQLNGAFVFGGSCGGSPLLPQPVDAPKPTQPTQGLPESGNESSLEPEIDRNPPWARKQQVIPSEPLDEEAESEQTIFSRCSCQKIDQKRSLSMILTSRDKTCLAKVCNVRRHR